MTEIITRDFINKNIKYIDYEKKFEYDFDTLSCEIDAFKNLLQQHGVDANTPKSAVITFKPGLQQAACIFACFELAVQICLIDYDRGDNFKEKDYIDSKTKRLMPIDYCISEDNADSGKRAYFSKVCNKLISYQDSELDYTPNADIFCNPDTLIMRCTSSGTTGTPKLIKHTHKFMYYLAKRNSKFYYGNCALVYNLNHGSSFATYFLPIIHNASTSSIYNISGSGKEFCRSKIIKLNKFLKNIDHIMLSYSRDINNIIFKSTPTVTIYTLSSISNNWKPCKDRTVKDIVSFFGSNETSGPTLINKLSFADFQSNRYRTVDNFYNIEIKKDTLHVKLPFYDDLEIDTKDLFVLDHSSDSYTFKGRDDLIKINGSPVKQKAYTQIVKRIKIIDSEIIYDVQENQIYLAVWKEIKNLEYKVKILSARIEKLSLNTHSIDKYAVLNKEDFLTGVKVDNELIRDYFRNFIN